MGRIIQTFVVRILAAAVLALVMSSGAAQAQSASPEAAEANRMGLQHFNEGFYQALPHQRDAEAAEKFALAEQEFKTAVRLNGKDALAHRNLARLYYVQENYMAAAGQYQRAAELTPSDTDAFVLAALAYAKAGSFAEAEAMLDAARAATADPRVIDTLNSYSEKLRQGASDPTNEAKAAEEQKP
jgi:tetratricopeptide (TPR) repeat protein